MNMQSQTFETVYVRRKFVAKTPVDGKNRSSMPEYRIWCGMIARCSNPNVSAFKRYGGRGIGVCDRWREDFANFYADIGPRPTSRHSVDRIDNDGNYEPDNCRWATPREQLLNRGDNHNLWTAKEYEKLKVMYLGYYTLAEIASTLDRSVATIRLRIHFEGLHRQSFLTKLANKNPDLRHLLQAGDKDAFIQAVTARQASRVKRTTVQRQQELQAIAERAQEIIRSSGSRNAKMRAMREAGLSLSDIGKHFSITRERVRQIEANGFPEDEGAPSGERRKVSKTNPKVRARKIDRLCRAWNAASREARIAFLAAAPAHFFSDIAVSNVVSTSQPEMRT